MHFAVPFPDQARARPEPRHPKPGRGRFLAIHTSTPVEALEGGLAQTALGAHLHSVGERQQTRG